MGQFLGNISNYVNTLKFLLKRQRLLGQHRTHNTTEIKKILNNNMLSFETFPLVIFYIV